MVSLFLKNKKKEGKSVEYTKHEQNLLDEWVMSQETKRIGFKTTIVCLIMKNGYEVIGMSACVNPEHYDEQTGIYWATKDALSKMDPIVGYIMQEKMFMGQE